MTAEDIALRWPRVVIFRCRQPRFEPLRRARARATSPTMSAPILDSRPAFMALTLPPPTQQRHISYWFPPRAMPPRHAARRRSAFADAQLPAASRTDCGGKESERAGLRTRPAEAGAPLSARHRREIGRWRLMARRAAAARAYARSARFAAFSDASR